MTCLQSVDAALAAVAAVKREIVAVRDELDVVVAQRRSGCWDADRLERLVRDYFDLHVELERAERAALLAEVRCVRLGG